LREAGFAADEIGLITQAVYDSADPIHEREDSKWVEGVVAGGAAGAGIGGLWALGISAGVLPVIGPVIAGGLLASVIASAAGGAAVGSVVGGLIGLGIPEDEAQHYESQFRAGRTIVTVQANGRTTDAAEVLRRNGGEIRNDPTTVLPPLPVSNSVVGDAERGVGRTD
jgi:hypothetical protein